MALEVGRKSWRKGSSGLRFMTSRNKNYRSLAIICWLAVVGCLPSFGDAPPVNLLTAAFMDGAESRRIGGTVVGLNASGLVLQLNGAETLTLNAAGAFFFNTRLETAAGYSVSIVTQPPANTQICGIANESGVVGLEDITNIVVTCADRPAVTATTPPQGGLIFDGDTITIQFSREMDPASCGIGAIGMGPEADNYPLLAPGAWNVTNTALTIAPAAAWSTGVRQLQITGCTDLSGATLLDNEFTLANGTIALSLFISQVGSVRYVQPTGVDVGGGGTTPADPLATIEFAYAELGACPTGTDCAILVATGDYTLPAGFALVEGKSLLGGFSLDYLQRNGATFPTRLFTADLSLGTLLTPNAVLSAGPGVTPLTSVTGFQIGASTAPGLEHVAGIVVNGGSPALVSNVIVGSPCTNLACTTRGVYVAAGSPVMQDLIVSSGTCASAGCISAGIDISSGNPILTQSGAASANCGGLNCLSIGVRVVLGGPQISLNIITSGDATGVSGESRGLEVNSAANLTNNLVSAGAADFRSAGFYGNASAGGPQLTRNIFRAGNAPISQGAYFRNLLLMNFTANTILGGTATGAGRSVGVECEGASFNRFDNNVIYGGAAVTNESIFGVYLLNCGNPALRSNTIDAGEATGGTSAAIYITVGSPTIESNILTARSAASTCVFESNGFSNPISLLNNVFHNCSVLYQDDQLGMPLTTLCAGGNPGNVGCTQTLASPAGLNNQTVNPVFVNPTAFDYRLNTNGSSPCSVLGGGIDFGPGFSADRIGVVRTPLVSGGVTAGAYEIDAAACP